MFSDPPPLTQFNCRKVCDERDVLEGVGGNTTFLAIVLAEAALQVRNVMASSFACHLKG